MSSLYKRTFEAPFQLLRDGYVPDLVEASRLRATVQDHELKLLELEAAIPSVEIEMKGKLVMTQNALQEKLSQMKALLAPVRRLPPEILAEIFVHCILPLPFNAYMYIPLADLQRQTTSPERAPLLLLRVCYRWRRIALKTSRLFTQFCQVGNLMAPVSVVSLWLNQSSTLPLDVLIFYEAETGICDKSDILEVFSMLSTHIHRFRTLGMFVSRYLEQIFPNGVTKQANNLETLQLVEANSIEPHGLPPSPRFINLGQLIAPQLRHFNVPKSLHFGPKFVCLGVQVTHFDVGMYGFREMIKLFTACPNLVHCAIWYEEGIFAETEPWDGYLLPVLVPHLKSFALTVDPSPLNELTHLATILQHLRTPILEEFILLGSCDFQSDMFLAMQEWLIVSNPPLTIATIDTSGFTLASFHDFLSILGHLTEFAFYGPDVVNCFFDILNRETNPKLCPSLTRLAFDDSAIIISDNFIKMIESRLFYDSIGEPDDRKEFLQEINLEGIRHSTTDVPYSDDEVYTQLYPLHECHPELIVIGPSGKELYMY